MRLSRWCQVLLAFLLAQGAILAYLYLVRGEASVFVTRPIALRHVVALRQLERWCHVSVESWLVGKAPAYLANEVYLWPHAILEALFVPLVGCFAFSLLWRVCLTSVAATMVCGAVAVVYPLAPPRLSPGFSDGLALTGVAGGRFSWDGYSAMPSYHVIFALLVVSVVWSCPGALGWLRAVSLAYAVGMAVLVVASGNHWVLDVMAAAPVWFLSVAVADRILALGRVIQFAAIRLVARVVPLAASAPPDVAREG